MTVDDLGGPLMTLDCVPHQARGPTLELEVDDL